MISVSIGNHRIQFESASTELGGRTVRSAPVLTFSSKRLNARGTTTEYLFSPEVKRTSDIGDDR